MQFILTVLIIAAFIFGVTFNGCGPTIHRSIEITLINGDRDTLENTCRLEPLLKDGSLRLYSGHAIALGHWDEYPYVNSFRVIKSDTLK